MLLRRAAAEGLGARRQGALLPALFKPLQPKMWGGVGRAAARHAVARHPDRSKRGVGGVGEFISARLGFHRVPTERTRAGGGNDGGVLT